MNRKTAAFITLGCKINQYETEAIRQEVLDLGYEEVASDAPADVYVVNTCAVTATSGSKSRKYIQRAARTNPDSRIIVVGCSTPSEKDSFREIPQVALLAGNEEKAMVAEFLEGGWRPGEPFAGKKRDLLDLRVSRYRDRTRATIKVQDGCNNFCSFCVIPLLRGTSRSRHPDVVAQEVRQLVANGYLEIVLSGVHLQDYGLDLDNATTLVALLRRLVEIDGLRRIRLSSLGARAFSDEMLDLLAHPVFCRHWHIPLQAGSDRVLDAMRRGYRVTEFRRAIEALETRFESPSITTDVIVGHPGEGEEDFDETLARCREFGFSKIHVFPFSLRENTLAAKLASRGTVHPVEVRRRARVLGELDRELRVAYHERFVGEELDVLVEGLCRSRGEMEPPRLQGLADRYLRVSFEAPSRGSIERFAGTIRRVRVTGAGLAGLDGEWAEEPIGAT